jgi:secreted protein with Ig-like and vWFA domain/Na+-transporting methylmalonyl-CoA/oxaloacetate decarboxylase gamma subunit
MNSDDKKPEMENSISPELEARIVAWVAGEASAFEAAELGRVAAEKPEIAAFKRRIEAAQGFVSEAVRPDKVPFRLAPERRAKLLQMINPAGNPVRPSAADTPVYLSPAALRRKQQSQFRWMMGAAACLLFGVFLVMQVVSSNIGETFGVSSEKAKEMRMIAATDLERRKQVVESALKYQEERKALKTDRYANAVPVEMPAVPEEADEDRSDAPTLDAAAPRLVDLPASRGATVPNQSTVSPQSAPAAASAYKGWAVQPWAHKEVKMAPVIVTAEEDDGSYRASDTLAGSRVRTDLKDVSSAITVVTQQFLEDAGARNNQDLLAYTPNTDVGGLHGNFAAAANAPARVSGEDWAQKTGDFGQAGIGPGSGSTAGGEGNPPAQSGSGSPANAAAAMPPDQPEAVLSQFVLGASDDNKGAAARSPDGTALQSEPVAAPASRDVRAKTASLKKDAEFEAGAAGGSEPSKPAVRPAPPVEASAEVNATKEPFSTFSLHVSDVSFRLAQAALARGQAPEPDSIRPEEFYNAFDYGDPAPATSDKIACRIEQAAHPFAQQRNLVRIAMKVPATGRGAGQPLRLTVLLDTSGSMEREDRAATVHRAMEVLVSLLGPADRVTLVGFARQPRLLAEEVQGDQAGALVNLIAHIPAEGGTNFEEAIKLGGELALRHFDPQAQNRIVLLTDGAANLGDADPEKLALQVEALRQQGLAFDACGVGTDGLDDAMLEALTRKGAGRYSILDSPESADAGFARQLAGAFRPAAENVKVQVRFNPARVGNYRLIGFEHHRLRTEDFRNDKVAAAELAAEEAAVALYQVEVLPQGEGELGDVYVRFRDTATGVMVERSWTMIYDPQVRAFDRATPTMQLAGTAALLAEKLRGGVGADQINLGELAPVVNALRSRYQHEARVQELATMFAETRRLEGR